MSFKTKIEKNLTWLGKFEAGFKVLFTIIFGIWTCLVAGVGYLYFNKPAPASIPTPGTTIINNYYSGPNNFNTQINGQISDSTLDYSKTILTQAKQ